jgi:asparagine synthase (glutamine-hydrolysing)
MGRAGRWHQLSRTQDGLMCGIFGGINTSFSAESGERLRHRGPDQQDYSVEDVNGEFTICLGQTRLSIVDRHDIELPVRARNASIVFNGEIYNWPELRKELEDLGWAFVTNTDTEVALVAYLQWGVACVSRFNGMFALAIWDGEKFFCARDRMGKKPFFYRCKGSSFEFASEVKALPDAEFVGDELFDLFEFCLEEHTLFRDVVQLRPGHYLLYDPRRRTLATASYWDIPHQVEPEITDPDEATDRFIELLKDSVALRMRADVPVTMFLSGGLDSTIIAAVAGIKEAFTCQFTEFVDTINEEKYARDFAKRLGIKLNIVRPNKAEFLHDLPALAYHLEMPTGSFSVFPLYRLAKAVHDAGYKVVLSGEGSDELFAGYVRNEFLLLDGQGQRVGEKAKNYSAMLSRYDGTDLDRFCRMASRSGLAGATAMKGYLKHLWGHRKTMLANMCYVETRIFLQALLQMADRMTMAHSVEARNPFLDYRIIEFAFTLDDSIRFRDGQGKWIVHEAARRLLPKDCLVLQRKVKHGLPTPVNLWMQGRHSFDRKYWNAILTAECIKNLVPNRP